MRYGGRLTTSPFSTTSTSMSRPPRRARARGSPAAAGPGRAGRSTRRRARPAGVTQGETEVANDLPRNGPSGTYSQAWMSRADQSFSPATPKTWSASASCGTGSPSRDGDAHDEAELGLDVEPAARAERRRRLVRRLALPARPDHGCAGHDDGPGAAVVADRQVPPVRRQRLAGRAGRSGRRWRRGPARHRSRRSRRPRTAGAASTSSTGSRRRTVLDQRHHRVPGLAATPAGRAP